MPQLMLVIQFDTFECIYFVIRTHSCYCIVLFPYQPVYGVLRRLITETYDNYYDCYNEDDSFSLYIYVLSVILRFVAYKHTHAHRHRHAHTHHTHTHTHTHIHTHTHAHTRTHTNSAPYLDTDSLPGLILTHNVHLIPSVSILERNDRPNFPISPHPSLQTIHLYHISCCSREILKNVTLVASQKPAFGGKFFCC